MAILSHDKGKPLHAGHDQDVPRIQEAMPDADTVMDLADLFKVLGDQTRVRLLLALSIGEACVCCLAEALEMSPSAVSHQLRVLRTAKLVRARRQGKNMYYALDDEHVHTLMAQGLDHVLEPR